MSIKLVTAVVTYNRKDLLIMNLNSQLMQTFLPQKILIIDNNSTDNTYGLLKEKGLIDNNMILYINTGTNLGGAGGFEVAIKESLKYDFDLLCLMDDDGRPFDKDTFMNLIDSLPSNLDLNTTPMFVNSVVMKDKINLTFPLNKKIATLHDLLEISNNNILLNRANPFNGTFINKSLIEKIGFPRGDFFIRYDEIDYYLKAKQCNAYIATIINSLYYHPSTFDFIEKKFLFIKFLNDYESGWKEYYKTRNYTRLRLEQGDSKMKVWMRYKFRIIGLSVFKIKDRKKLKLFMKKGFKDALNNNMGKIVNPGQLSI